MTAGAPLWQVQSQFMRTLHGDSKALRRRLSEMRAASERLGSTPTRKAEAKGGAELRAGHASEPEHGRVPQGSGAAQAALQAAVDAAAAAEEGVEREGAAEAREQADQVGEGRENLQANLAPQGREMARQPGKPADHPSNTPQKPRASPGKSPRPSVFSVLRGRARLSL